VAQAIHNYQDIPLATRNKLIEKVNKKNYDEIVTISSEGVPGYSNLRDMHFGTKELCRTVIIPDWGSKQERGLVFCADNECIIIPTVCRNVSRINKRKSALELKTALPYNFIYEIGINEIQIPTLQPADFTKQSFISASKPVEIVATGQTTQPGAFSAGYVQLPYVTTYNFDSIVSSNFPVTPIPEPSTYILMLLGLSAIFLRKYVARNI
jgi:hypothetical protein